MVETPRIVLHGDKTGPLEKALVEAFPDANYRICNSYTGLPELIGDYRPEVVYTVRFAGTPGYPRDALFSAHGPRWISNGGAGTDHFGTWDPARVTVTNAAGVAADMMAEYILGGFLHFALDVPGLLRDQRDRIWDAARMVTPLNGKTLLIVGLGHTGRALALRAKAFGMTVIGTRGRPKPTTHVDEVHGSEMLEALLPRADMVAVCTPLTPQTRGLIGARQIARMRQGVVLADVSRGGVVDQTALLAALKEGRIKGAALDVFETEPLGHDSPLWALENVLISPHCSSVFAAWDAASFALFMGNLRRWIAGESLQNIVDPVLGY